MLLANIVSCDIIYDLPSLTAWAAARLARGCGEQAFGEVKHLIMIAIALKSLILGFSLFLHHIRHCTGWEGSHNNRHGVAHPPRLQQALWRRDLSLDLKHLKFCDHAIKCQYKASSSEMPSWLLRLCLFLRPAKTCKHCEAVLRVAAAVVVDCICLSVLAGTC